MRKQLSGAGMAGRSHAAAYRMAGSVSGPGLPPIRLAAIADANTALAEDGARRYGYEKALPSWEAVAEDPSIDAVSIVVGNALHRPIAEALVGVGKHVLCEKPSAGSMDDARAMVELQKQGKVVTAVGYCYRRSPAIAAIRDHIRAGELGELTTLHARYRCDYACDPRGPLSWRFKRGMGGGALGDIGAHIIDQGEYLCGPIVSVAGGNLSIQIPKRPLPLGAVVGHAAAPVSSEMGEVENEDTATFTARFQSGLAATFSVSRTAFGMPNGLGVDVYGAAGRASFDFHRPAEYLLEDAQPEARTRGLRRVIVGPKHADDMRRLIELAGALGVKNIVCMSGTPGSDPDARYPSWVVNPWDGVYMGVLDYQWDVAAKFWTETDALARANDVRMAIEMHPHNLVFSPVTLKKLVDLVGAINVGAEMDPSHLMWQGMDIVASIKWLGPLVFHAAAKDAAITPGVDIRGVLDTSFERVPADAEGKVPTGYGFWCNSWPENPGWRFVAVGIGHDVEYWTEFLRALSEIDPDMAVNIEHEDADYGRLKASPSRRRTSAPQQQSSKPQSFRRCSVGASTSAHHCPHRNPGRRKRTLSHRTPPRSVVARLTAILATFRTGSVHSVSGIARLTGLPVSTTHRMVNELAGRNLLYRRADSLYEVGSALRGLGDGAWSVSTLQQQGAHLLTDLSEATGHRARLGVLVGGRVAYVEKRFGPDPATTFARDAILPAHATALGKALLAFTPPASVAHIVGPLTTFTPQTLDTLDRLHHALHVIRVRKLAMSLEEHFAGECTIAAPVFAPDGTVAAAVEVEVAHSRRDFQLCRAALMVGSGALTRELASTTPGAFSQLEIVPGSVDSGRACLEPIRPGRRRLRQTLVREVDIRGAQEA